MKYAFPYLLEGVSLFSWRYHLYSFDKEGCLRKLLKNEAFLTSRYSIFVGPCKGHNFRAIMFLFIAHEPTTM
jgi:hypothetical protein